MNPYHLRSHDEIHQLLKIFFIAGVIIWILEASFTFNPSLNAFFRRMLALDEEQIQKESFKTLLKLLKSLIFAFCIIMAELIYYISFILCCWGNDILPKRIVLTIWGLLLWDIGVMFQASINRDCAKEIFNKRIRSNKIVGIGEMILLASVLCNCFVYAK